jgi:type II secretion system protein N
MTNEDTSLIKYARKLPKRQYRFIILTLFLTMTLSLLKIPSSIIHNWVKELTQDLLYQQGIELFCKDFRFSLLSGMTLEMRKGHVKMLKTPDLHFYFDTMILKPSLFALLLGKRVIRLTLQEKETSVQINLTHTKNLLKIFLQSQKVPLEKLPIALTGLDLNFKGLLNTDIDVTMTNMDPFKASGQVNLQVQEFLFEPQNILGFDIPLLKVKAVDIKTHLSNGKIQIDKAVLGGASQLKDSDITANITGFIQLIEPFDSSTIALSTQFSFSDHLMKSFIILDSLLAPAKKSDGSFGYKISGKFNNPIFEVN